jgi:beta-lactamase class A
MLSSKAGRNNATQDLCTLTPVTSHNTARNTLIRRMSGLKSNLLLWPADLSKDSVQAWRQLILTEEILVIGID